MKVKKSLCIFFVFVLAISAILISFISSSKFFTDSASFTPVPTITKFKVGEGGNIEQLPEGIILLYPNRYRWYSAMTLDTRRNAKTAIRDYHLRMDSCDGANETTLGELFHRLDWTWGAWNNGIHVGFEFFDCRPRGCYGCGGWYAEYILIDGALGKVVFDTNNIPSNAEVYLKQRIAYVQEKGENGEKDYKPFDVGIYTPYYAGFGSGTLAGSIHIEKEKEGLYENFSVYDYIKEGETSFRIDHVGLNDMWLYPKPESDVPERAYLDDFHLLFKYPEGVNIKVRQTLAEPSSLNKLDINEYIPLGAEIIVTLHIKDTENNLITLGPYHFTNSTNSNNESDGVSFNCVTAKEIKYEIKFIQNENGDAPVLYSINPVLKKPSCEWKGGELIDDKGNQYFQKLKNYSVGEKICFNETKKWKVCTDKDGGNWLDTKISCYAERNTKEKYCEDGYGKYFNMYEELIIIYKPICEPLDKIVVWNCSTNKLITEIEECLCVAKIYGSRGGHWIDIYDGADFCIDLDKDGYAGTGNICINNSYFDCNDNNSSIYPNATEIPCNNIDEDCDGKDLCCHVEEPKETTYRTSIIKFNITLPNKAKYLKYIDHADKVPREKILCMRCSEYGNKRKEVLRFKTGFHNITIFTQPENYCNKNIVFSVEPATRNKIQQS